MEAVTPETQKTKLLVKKVACSDDEVATIKNNPTIFFAIFPHDGKKCYVTTRETSRDLRKIKGWELLYAMGYFCRYLSPYDFPCTIKMLQDFYGNDFEISTTATG